MVKKSAQCKLPRLIDYYIIKNNLWIYVASISSYITTIIARTVRSNSINIEQAHRKLWHHKHRNHVLESYDVLHYS